MREAPPARVTLESSTPLALTDVGRARLRAVPANVFAAADGPGAVVLARGPSAWGPAFAARNMSTLVVDPYAARPAWRVSEAAMLADAFAALAVLAARPGIDGTRIAIVGEGPCGAAALLSAYVQIADLFAAGGARFGAHVSVHGSVAARLEDYRTTGAMVALLCGPGDPAERSHRALVLGDLLQGGSRVEEIVLGMAPHGRRPPRSARDVRITLDNVLVDDRSGRALGRLGSRVRLAAAALSGLQRARTHLAGPQADGVLIRSVGDVLTRA